MHTKSKPHLVNLKNLKKQIQVAAQFKAWVRIPLGHGCLSLVSVVRCQVRFLRVFLEKNVTLARNSVAP